jgi:hypothetical protein
MPTKDDFTLDDSMPLFLSEHADEREQQQGKAWDRAVISPRILKTSIAVVSATAIGIAILSVGNPVTLFSDVTASLVDISALQPGTDQSTPTIQPTADTQALPSATSDAPPVNPGANPESAPPLDDKTALRPPTSGAPTATDVPTRNEIAAASEPTDQSQTENRQASADALFKQFQAWKAERAQVQPAQDAPAQVVQDARPQVRPMKKHRQQRSGLCKIPEKRSGGSKMHRYRSRPYKTPEHRISPCKMPRHRRSCKVWVGAIRPDRIKPLQLAVLLNDGIM